MLHKRQFSYDSQFIFQLEVGSFLSKQDYFIMRTFRKHRPRDQNAQLCYEIRQQAKMNIILRSLWPRSETDLLVRKCFESLKFPWIYLSQLHDLESQVKVNDTPSNNMSMWTLHLTWECIDDWYFNQGIPTFAPHRPDMGKANLGQRVRGQRSKWPII